MEILDSSWNIPILTCQKIMLEGVHWRWWNALFLKIDSNKTFLKCHYVYISECHFVVNFHIEYQNFKLKSKVRSQH